MSNTYGATWELSQLPTFALDLRLVNSYNQTLTIRHAPYPPLHDTLTS